MTVDYIVGDTRETVAAIPDGSVSLVACSPPFIALRSYLPADHPDKDKEIGSEPDPATFLDTLLGLTAEWGRVLAPWGSIAIELGDTYAGGGGWAKDDAKNPWHTVDETPLHVRGSHPAGRAWPRAKCLALVPQLYAASLAYGRNLLTGEPSPAGQWLVRNMIVWHRPNPAVGALGDKYRPSTSYITVATRSPKRWFDLTAVRTAHKVPEAVLKGRPATLNRTAPGQHTDPNETADTMTSNPAGAPPLDTWLDEYDMHDTWTMTTQPSALAHYAMWPAKLAERLILSMCPAQVCNVCGEPRRRIESVERSFTNVADGAGLSAGALGRGGPMGAIYTSATTTLGWSDCGHDDCRPGVVLDPFAGTGTTLAVADLHGRDAIGVDIDDRNRELYPRRYDEVKRNLFGTVAEMVGQVSLFDEVAS